tara:strand:- start:14179 stop:16428 length:2250 start_codon:yes stop_codon:yes gene_type:complete
MGGLYGHLSHLYDFNIDVPALRFSELAEIFQLAAGGKLIGTEKIDGQAMYITYVTNDIDDSFSGVVMGRNKTDVRTASRMLDSPGEASGSLINTFKKFEFRNPELRNAFVDSLRAFERGIKNLDHRTQKEIFGPDEDGNYNWYMFEVLDPKNPNVINYDKYGSVLVLHAAGHGKFDGVTANKLADLATVDTDTGLASLIDSNPLRVLKSLIDGINDHLQQKNERFRIIQNELRSLVKPFNPAPYIQRLQAEMRSTNLREEDTTEEYVTMRILSIASEAILDAFAAGPPPEETIAGEELVAENQVGERTEDFFETRNKDIYLKYSENIRMLVQSLVDLKGRKRLIFKGLDSYQRDAVNQIIAKAAIIRNDALKPIEIIIHDFAVQLLDRFESAYIVNNDATAKEFRDDVLNKIQSIDRHFKDESGELFGDQRKRMMFDKNIEKLQTITTAAEGFTFTYNGHLYKFTGNFAPLNQLLGMEPGKFARESLDLELQHDFDLLKESLEPRTQVTMFIPGGFKPPTAGHFSVFEQAALTFPTSNIHILIGGKDRDGITPHMSQRAWELIISDSKLKMPTFVVMGEKNTDPYGIMESNSPVRYIYSYASDMAKDGEVVIPVFSADREVGDTRFARLKDFAAEGVKVQVFSAKEMEGVSGTSARQALQANDRTSWELLMPTHISYKTKEQLWELFVDPNDNDKQFDLEETIAEELAKFDEISAMAAGAVEGHTGNPDDDEDEEKESLIREVMNYLLA